MDSIKQQLLQFGYVEDAIDRAISIVVDKHDINEIIAQIELDNDRLYPFEKFTNEELTNLLIHGYIHSNDKDKQMLSDLINMIELFYGTYFINGWMTMTLKEVLMLNIGDRVDHRDDVGRFLLATIVEKQDTKFKIHYEGWSNKWDIWSDFREEIHRFAKAGAISRRPAQILKGVVKRHYVDINPVLRHPGWTVGEVRRVDKYSPQVQVVYRGGADNKEFLYWTHVDNEDEMRKWTPKMDLENIDLVSSLHSYLQRDEHAKIDVKIAECFLSVCNHDLVDAINTYKVWTKEPVNDNKIIIDRFVTLTSCSRSNAELFLVQKEWDLIKAMDKYYKTPIESRELLPDD